MYDCPVCNSRLHIQRVFPHLFKQRFICDICGWKMDLGEVHRRGGLYRIAIDTAKEGKRHSQSNWERIEKLPEWAFNKMERRKRNIFNGEHYIYKREGKKFYRKQKYAQFPLLQKIPKIKR